MTDTGPEPDPADDDDDATLEQTPAAAGGDDDGEPAQGEGAPDSY